MKSLVHMAVLLVAIALALLVEGTSDADGGHQHWYQHCRWRAPALPVESTSTAGGGYQHCQWRVLALLVEGTSTASGGC